MLKRIMFITLIITVVGVFIFSILSANVYYNSSLDFAKEQLTCYMQSFDETEPFDKSGADEFSQKLFGARVTYLQCDGTVVGDSAMNASEYENHKNRSEVISALNYGFGFSVRNSSSANTDMIYYCVKITSELCASDGTVYNGGLVRIALRTNSFWSVFLDSLPALLWLLLLVSILCLFLSLLSTSFILKPVENLTREMALSGGKHVTTKYSELKPLVKLMNSMSDEIKEKSNKLSADSELEILILNSMEHGMVIFRSPSDVVLINRTAAKLLDYEENEPIRLFVENTEIANVLKTGEIATIAYKFYGRDYMLRFTKVEETHVLLMTDVTESVAAEKSKNELIANVTHEMNTPLTSIKGFAELIASGSLDKTKCVNAADTIIKQSDRLAKLIRSIINFSAIDNDELSPYDVDLSALLKETVLFFEPKIAEKNIRLELDLDDGVTVLSRRERLVEIVNNLVSNAIRYNKEGGFLKITLKGGKTPKLCVEDSGIGISEENLPHIFSRFYTVDKSHNGSGGGFGLGLAIVKKLCNRAGWKLFVESELGKGTSFKIEFVSP